MIDNVERCSCGCTVLEFRYRRFLRTLSKRTQSSEPAPNMATYVRRLTDTLWDRIINAIVWGDA